MKINCERSRICGDGVLSDLLMGSGSDLEFVTELITGFVTGWVTGFVMGVGFSGEFGRRMRRFSG